MLLSKWLNRRYAMHTSNITSGDSNTGENVAEYAESDWKINALHQCTMHTAVLTSNITSGGSITGENVAECAESDWKMHCINALRTQQYEQAILPLGIQILGRIW